MSPVGGLVKSFHDYGARVTQGVTILFPSQEARKCLFLSIPLPLDKYVLFR